ncbi:MAG: glycoside hydrolase family 13 protein [Clostridia bacterium]|nr:glycoside hydrolase family 13 protein [Clostridia bacterium]
MLPFHIDQYSPFTVKKTVLSNTSYNCAFEEGKIKISLLCPRIYCLNGCYLKLDHDFESKTDVVKMRYCGIEDGCDLYTCTVSPCTGLYYFYFTALCDGKEYTVESCGDEKHGRITEEYPDKFQLMIYKTEYTPVKWFSDGAMYHIFVDRFCRSDRKIPVRDDAVMINDWYGGKVEYAEYPGQPLKNNTFFGGDLYGICSKLDYLSSLGITTLYLSPVFKAYSNHKYDTGDYTAIDEMFGGQKAFKKLVKEAHSRNMKIILDGVFNHTGDDSIYFNKYKKYDSCGAYNGKESPYYSWYDFSEYPDKYRSWWGISILPSLNHTRSSLREFLCGENGVIRYWLRQGADGWRLDVADELPEDLLFDIKKAADAEKPGSLVIGEVWEDASNKIAYSSRRHYFSGKALDGVMNYPLRNAVISYSKYGDECAMNYALTILSRHYPQYSLLNTMNFLGTHDTERILTVLGGEDAANASGSQLSEMRMTPEQLKEGKKRLRFAFALLACCPGVPCIYYGDEAGCEGYRDPFNRRPYPWGKEDTELVEYFKNILKMRKKHKALRGGKTDVVYAENGVLVFRRYIGNHGVLCIFNGNQYNKCVYVGGEKLMLDGMSFTLKEYAERNK